MRLIYIDESGTSANENIALVAGAVIEFDAQLGVIEGQLGSIIKDHVAPQKQFRFAFHATELFSGGKKTSAFPKSSTTPQDRWPILHKLAALPSLNKIPIIVGYVNKSLCQNEGIDNQDTWHAIAYTRAVLAADVYMKTYAAAGEHALIVAENKPEVHRGLKNLHFAMQTDGLAQATFGHFAAHMPITRVRDTVHFAAKDESPALQIADVCAFIIRRHFEQRTSSEGFFNTFLGGQYMPPPPFVTDRPDGFGVYAWEPQRGPSRIAYERPLAFSPVSNLTPSSML